MSAQPPPPPRIPPGWYPDPSGGPTKRYWNGTHWEGFHQPPTKSRTGGWVRGISAAMGVIAVGWFLWWFLGFGPPDIEDLERTTAEDIQNYFNTEPEYQPYHLQISDLQLVHEGDNRYTGFFDATPLRGEGRQISVEVIWDDDRGMWRLPPGALAWLAFEATAGSS